MALGMWEFKEFLKTVLIVSQKSHVLANTVLFYYNYIRQRFNSKSCDIVMWSIEVRWEKGENGWKAKANPIPPYEELVKGCIQNASTS